MSLLRSGWVLFLIAAPLNAAVSDPGNLNDRVTLGLQLMVLGMGVVFVGLLAVYGFLAGLKRSAEQRPRAISGDPAAPPPEVTVEVAHAIALALYMDLRTFDEDVAEEITIQKVTRPYSPWWNAGKMQTMHDQSEIFGRSR